MLKKLMLSAAIGALAVGGALAQSPADKSADKPAATTTQTSPAKTDTMKSDSLKSDTMKSETKSDSKMKPEQAADSNANSIPGGNAMASAPANAVITSQQSNQLLASKFTGTDVIGTDDKKIGDVSDILFDKEGKIEAYVVSVGGFLGVGSKEVALAPAAFEPVTGTNLNDTKLKLAMTKEERKDAAEFKRYQMPYAKPTAMERSGGTTGGMRTPTNPPRSGSR